MIEDLPSLALNAVIPDPWTKLASITPARLALGRAGGALPTGQVLGLAMAHAQARDAVHAVFEAAVLAAAFQSLGHDSLAIESAAPTREIYLRRPDLGRRLSPRSREALIGLPRHEPDVSIVVADGLSATAVHQNAAALIDELLPALYRRGYRLSPMVLAQQARVALGDEIGQLLGSRMMIVLIGERPGLSAADSLGAYLTIAPRIGRSDAERNCVSNIRPNGLVPSRAAAKIAWLIERAFALSLTGVGLKDDSDGSLAAVPRRALSTSEPPSGDPARSAGEPRPTA